MKVYLKKLTTLHIRAVESEAVETKNSPETGENLTHITLPPCPENMRTSFAPGGGFGERNGLAGAGGVLSIIDDVACGAHKSLEIFHNLAIESLPQVASK